MAATNRRQLLTGAAAYAAGAAIVATGAALASEAKGASLSPALSKLIADADAANKAVIVFDDTVYEPTRVKAMALIEAIPHASVDIDGDDYWTTAKPGAVRVARRFVDNDPHRQHPSSQQFRSLLAADRGRERQAQQIKKSTGLSAAMKTADALSEASVAAEWAVANYACRTASDLHAKLSFMLARQMDHGIAMLEYILPDALCLANAEGR